MAGTRQGVPPKKSMSQYTRNSGKFKKNPPGTPGQKGQGAVVGVPALRPVPPANFKDVGGSGTLLPGPVDHLVGEGGVVQVAHEPLALGVVAVGLAGDDQNGGQRQAGSGVLEADVPPQGRAAPGTAQH